MECSFLCCVHGPVSWCSLPACYPRGGCLVWRRGINWVALCLMCRPFSEGAGPGAHHAYHTYCAAVAETELDVLTGEYGIKRVDIMFDCGERWAMQRESYDGGGRGGGGELQWKQCVVAMWSKWGWRVMKGHAMTHHRWTWTFCCSGNGEQ